MDSAAADSVCFPPAHWKLVTVTVVQPQVVLADPAGLGLEVPKSEGSSALCQAATPRAYKGAAGEKTVTGNLPVNKIDSTLFRLGARAAQAHW